MSSKKKTSTRKLTVTGMMIAITMILAYTPLGIIPLQPVSATITHIPTIIIALLEGPIVGAIIGAAFGIVSLIKALTQPAGILDPYFINPLVSILPRVLIGIVAGYSYKGFLNVIKNGTLCAVLASALGSLTNTLGAMGMIYVLYLSDMTQKLGTAAGPVIWGIITTYGIVEMLAAAVICTTVVLALKKAVYRSTTA
ncbi:MAG TPA: ECF transporter S component [Candidatus Coprocola pullicola]|nr:ECF transporter S component [Candidatus Coprocola pullicola]